MTLQLGLASVLMMDIFLVSAQPLAGHADMEGYRDLRARELA